MNHRVGECAAFTRRWENWYVCQLLNFGGEGVGHFLARIGLQSGSDFGEDKFGSRVSAFRRTDCDKWCVSFSCILFHWRGAVRVESVNEGVVTGGKLYLYFFLCFFLGLPRSLPVGGALYRRVTRVSHVPKPPPGAAGELVKDWQCVRVLTAKFGCGFFFVLPFGRSTFGQMTRSVIENELSE